MKLILTENEQFELVIRCPANISFIHNPTRSVIEQTIAQDGTLIKYIPDQDEELQLLALKSINPVQCDVNFYKSLINPSYEVDMKALEMNGDLLNEVSGGRDIDDKLARKLIRDNPKRIEQFQDPEYDLQIIAVKGNANTISSTFHFDAHVMALHGGWFIINPRLILTGYDYIFDNDIYNPKYHKYYVHAIELLDDFHEEIKHLPGSLQILKNKKTEISLLFAESDLSFLYY